jgi:hypothetical protein
VLFWRRARGVGVPQTVNILVAQDTTLKFAGGYASIMPRDNVYLAGYGPDRRSLHDVGEPLEANVVLFQSGCGRIVFVQLDVLSVGEQLRHNILARLGGRLQDEELFLVASHTHFAPNLDTRLAGMARLDDAYLASVTETVCGLVDRTLSASLEPVGLRYAEGQANHSINRRRWCLAPALRFPPVKRVMGLQPNPRGLRDETVRVFLAATDAEGMKPVGMLWNYACHPVTTWPWLAISADYPGVIRRALRDRYNHELPVVFLPGFSGDIRPNHTTGLPLSPYYLLHRIVNGPVFGKFDARSSRQWTSSLAEVVLSAVARGSSPVEVTGIGSRRRCLRMRDLMTGEVDDRRLTFQLVNIDPQFSFPGVSAEPVAEYKPAVCDRLPHRTVVPVGYIDGVCGYLPTSEMLSEGGLEVASPGYSLEGAKFRPGLSEIVLDSMSELYAALTRGCEEKPSDA